MNDGRYEHVASIYANLCETEAEAEALTDKFLESFDEKDANGNYVQDIDTWSIKGLYEAMTNADIRAGRRTSNLNEALGTSSFPQAISGLVAKKALRSHDEYNASRRLIGDQLVRVVPTKKKSEKVIRNSAHPLFKLKPEGVDTQPFEFAEAYYGYRTNRFSRAVTITEEVVMFDQTDSIWENARKMGVAAALSKEYLILHGVLDLSTTHQMGLWDAADASGLVRVYRPSDSASDLYGASAPTGASTDGNLITSNGLEDWTDIQNCKSRLNNFLDDTPEKLNDNSSNTGKRIVQPREKVLLIPEALEEKAFQILGTRMTPFDANNSLNPAGPGGPLAAPYVCSNILDDQSATTWYYGAFKEQFEYREVYPFRLITMDRRGSLELIRKGLYSEVHGDFYAGVAATSNYFVVKCTA